MTTMINTIMTIKENSHLSLMFWFSLLRRASALLFIIKIKSIMSITTIYNGNRTVSKMILNLPVEIKLDEHDGAGDDDGDVVL